MARLWRILNPAKSTLTPIDPTQHRLMTESKKLKPSKLDRSRAVSAVWLVDEGGTDRSTMGKMNKNRYLQCANQVLSYGKGLNELRYVAFLYIIDERAIFSVSNLNEYKH